MFRARQVMLAILSLGCLGPADALSAAAANTASVETLRKLADTYWQGTLEANPTWATSLGDRRYDDRLDDNSPAGIQRDTRRLEGALAQVEAIDPAGLDADSRLTRTALLVEIQEQLAYISCGFYDWVVDPLNGPQVDFMNLPDITTFDSPADGANYVKRCRAMGAYMDQHIANLRGGLSRGRTASRDAVNKTIDQLGGLTKSPPESLALWRPAAAELKGWGASEKKRFSTDLRAAIQSSVLPALRRYDDFLRAEILPAARPPERAGLAALPGGQECYKKMIRAHTSLDMTADEVHALGLEQVAKFRSDLAALGQKVFGTSDIKEIQKRLRTSPDMHFRTAEEVEAKARESLARAQAAVPKWFGKVQPHARCAVEVMGMHEAPYSTIAYYSHPSPDGKRPGVYKINTYRPETRPRYEAEALAFHESVPGHHLQIAIAQELQGIPEFRKHQGVTAFVEGWGLYAERLADEMGLYSSDLDRIGMLSYDAWRACRLVVDTGLHAKGWSRQQAIDYMVENTLLAENNIVNEVDRYLTRPGQALAYKLGQLEILKLREEAKQRLGDRFDIRDFHDVVLGAGAVPLPALRERVERYAGS
jgi:uncharacterized protein (DUF885 family)